MMTKTQKKIILDMRAEGITYNAIAAQMGMSPGSVKIPRGRKNPMLFGIRIPRPESSQ